MVSFDRSSKRLLVCLQLFEGNNVYLLVALYARYLCSRAQPPGQVCTRIKGILYTISCLVVYKIPYRRARLAFRPRKGILHTSCISVLSFFTEHYKYSCLQDTLSSRAWPSARANKGILHTISLLYQVSEMTSLAEVTDYYEIYHFSL